MVPFLCAIFWFPNGAVDKVSKVWSGLQKSKWGEMLSVSYTTNYTQNYGKCLTENSRLHIQLLLKSIDVRRVLSKICVLNLTPILSFPPKFKSKVTSKTHLPPVFSVVTDTYFCFSLKNLSFSAIFASCTWKKFPQRKLFYDKNVDRLP